MVKTLIILGPTAVGKTGVSILLAERIGGEIISADSMQVYRGMDVATAKPSAAQFQRVPHHLIGILEVGESYSAARFRKLALDLIREIKRRGRRPIIVGGSGLYLKALFDGFSDSPPADWAFRRLLREEEKRNGRGHLYRRLAELDPSSAERIHENDLKRIIRALEVLELSGVPMSKWQKEWPVNEGRGTMDEGRGTMDEGRGTMDEGRGTRDEGRRTRDEGPFDFAPFGYAQGLRQGKLGMRDERRDFLMVGLRRDRADLYNRINERVEEMFKKGLVEETKRLLERGADRNRVAWQALGYKEVEGFLRGEYSLKEARRRLSRNTRHFAKRQLTWWRRDERIRWIDIESSHTVEDTVETILNLLKGEEKNK